MSTFTWVEDQGSSASVKPKVLRAQFGDGYSQRTPDGINNRLETFKLSFSLLDQATYDAILTFLEAQGGVTAFDWTPHGRSAGKFICGEWEKSFAYKGTISATFEQVYEY